MSSRWARSKWSMSGPLGDGAARAGRRRRRAVQGVRAGAGVRAEAHCRALHALSRPGRRGPRLRRRARVAAPRRCGHPRSASSATHRRRGSSCCRSTPSSNAARSRTRTTISSTASPTCESRRCRPGTTTSCSASCRSGARRSIGCARSPLTSRSCATSSSRTASRERCSTTTSTCRMCTRVTSSFACSTGATRRSRTHSRRSSSRSGSSRRSPSFRREIPGSRGARRLPGTVGSRPRGRVRARDPRRQLRARDRMAAAARPPSTEGSGRVRPVVPGRATACDRSDRLAAVLGRDEVGEIEAAEAPLLLPPEIERLAPATDLRCAGARDEFVPVTATAERRGRSRSG